MKKIRLFGKFVIFSLVVLISGWFGCGPDVNIPIGFFVNSPTNEQVVLEDLSVAGTYYFPKDKALLSSVNIFVSPFFRDVTNTYTASIIGEQAYTFNKDIPFNQAGFYYIWVETSDENEKKMISDEYYIIVELEGSSNDIIPDRLPPAVTINNPSSGQSVGATFTFSGTATDNSSGVAGVYAKLDSASFKKVSYASGNWSTNYQVSTSGNHTVSVYAIDHVGNVSTTNSVTCNYVTDLPSVTIDSPANGLITSSSTINVSGTASIASGTIAKVELKLNSAAYKDVGNTTWSTNNIKLIEGQNTLTVRAISSGGKTNTSPAVTVNLDSTRPAGSITYPTNGSVISNTSITVAGTASDSGTGVQSVYLGVDGSYQLANGTTSWNYTISPANGPHNLSVYVKDGAGNISLTNSVSFTQTNYSGGGGITAPTVLASPTTSEFTNDTLLVTLYGAGSNVTVRRYTTNGSDPAFSGADYTNGQKITVGASTVNGASITLRLYAVNSAGEARKQYSYTKNTGEAALPVISASPGGGNISGSSVDVSLNLSGSGITASRWTTNGNDPASGGNDFTNGEVITLGASLTEGQSITLKMYAANSTTNKSATYTFSKPSGDGSKPYYVNPTFGSAVANGGITIDGDGSDWSSNMIVALDMANDDPRTLEDNWTTHEPPIDFSHIWVAWDDSYLYVAWQTVDVTDAIDPSNAGSGDPLSGNDGILIWMLLDTIQGQGASDDMWGKDNSWSGTDLPDYQLYMAGSLWQGYVSRASNGVFPVDDGEVNYMSFSSATIDVINAASFEADELWGVLDCDDALIANPVPVDMLNVGKNGDTHQNFTRDGFYEIKIPLSFLQIDRNYIETTGIGVMVGAGAQSSLDCIPNDPTTTDTPGVESYNSSFEWSDVDVFTADFARIGAAK